MAEQFDYNDLDRFDGIAAELMSNFGAKLTSGHRPGATVRGTKRRSMHGEKSGAYDLSGVDRGTLRQMRQYANLRGYHAIIEEPGSRYAAPGNKGPILHLERSAPRGNDARVTERGKIAHGDGGARARELLAAQGVKPGVKQVGGDTPFIRNWSDIPAAVGGAIQHGVSIGAKSIAATLSGGNLEAPEVTQERRAQAAPLKPQVVMGRRMAPPSKAGLERRAAPYRKAPQPTVGQKIVANIAQERERAEIERPQSKVGAAGEFLQGATEFGVAAAPFSVLGPAGMMAMGSNVLSQGAGATPQETVYDAGLAALMGQGGKMLSGPLSQIVGPKVGHFAAFPLGAGATTLGATRDPKAAAVTAGEMALLSAMGLMGRGEAKPSEIQPRSGLAAVAETGPRAAEGKTPVVPEPVKAPEVAAAPKAAAEPFPLAEITGTLERLQSKPPARTVAENPQVLAEAMRGMDKGWYLNQSDRPIYLPHNEAAKSGLRGPYTPREAGELTGTPVETLKPTGEPIYSLDWPKGTRPGEEPIAPPAPAPPAKPAKPAAANVAPKAKPTISADTVTPEDRIRWEPEVRRYYEQELAKAEGSVQTMQGNKPFAKARSTQAQRNVENQARAYREILDNLSKPPKQRDGMAAYDIDSRTAYLRDNAHVAASPSLSSESATQPAKGAAGEGQKPPEMMTREQDFYTFAKERGWGGPMIAPEGLADLPKASRNAVLKRFDDNSAMELRLRQEYQKAVSEGAIVDPTGEYKPKAPNPSAEIQKAERLRKQAQELRELAARGMKPRAYVKQAEALEAEAAKLTAPTPAPPAAVAKRTVSLEVNGETRTVDLTPEQAKAWDAAQQQHEDALRLAERWRTENPDVAEKRIKAAGMRFAADKRRITGLLTVKETAAQKKAAARLSPGSAVEVTVDGKAVTGKVASTPFGKVVVETPGGRITVPREQVRKGAAPVETPVAPEPTPPVTPAKKPLPPEVQAARDALHQKWGTKRIVAPELGPEDLGHLATIGKYHIREGAKDFAQWSKAMLDDLGEAIKPHLAAIWQASGGAVGKAESIGGAVASAANKATEIDRAMAGLSPIERAKYGSHRTTLEKGRAAVDSGEVHPASLSPAILEKPRPLSGQEEAGILYDITRIKSTLADLRGKLEKAMDAGADETALREQINFNENLLDTHQQALVVGGRELGGALGFRNALAQEDMSLEAVLQRKRIVEGRKLTAEEESSLTRQVKELEANQQRQAEELAAIEEIRRKQEARIAELQAQQTAPGRTPKVIKKPADFLTFTGGEANTIVTRERMEAAVQRLAERRKRLNAGVDPTAIADVAEIVGFYTESGARFAYSTMHGFLREKFPDLDSDTIRAGWQRAMNDERLAASKERLRQALLGGTRRESAPPVIPDAELLSLRKALREKRTPTLAERLAANKERARLRIEAMKAGERPAEARPRPEEDIELLKLRAEERAMRERINAETKPSPEMTLWEKTKEYGNIPRTLQTMADPGTPFRQLIKMAAANPREWWLSTRRAYDLLFRGKNLGLFREMRVSNPHYGLAKAARLYEAPPPGEFVRDVGQRVEEFAGAGPLKKVPLFRNLVIAGERSFAESGNTMRFEIFYKHARQFGDSKPLEWYRDLAKLINAGTGRGNLMGLEHAAGALSAGFYAPRYKVSHIQFLLGAARTDPAIRKIAAKNLVGYLGTGLTFLALCKAAGASVQMDPRSSDFGVGKFGNHRLDPWGGARTIVRQLAQLFARQTIPAGAKKPRKADPERLAANMIRGAAAPPVGAIWSSLKGTDFKGDEYNLSHGWSIAGELVTPLFLQDAVDAWKDGGWGEGIAFGLMSWAGLGTNTYKAEPSRSTMRADLVDQFRAGKIDLGDLRENKDLRPRERDRILREATDKPETWKFRNMRLPQALEAFKDAKKPQRQEWRSILVAKIMRSDLTPTERRGYMKKLQAIR